MRLRQLHLARYGHFEAQVLDFGARAAGESDVTIVFGANEAGKSTAFAAWLDVLYGFAARNHPYAFVFDRKDLSVGARIEAAGETLEVWRTAKKTGSLVDADGREVSEHKLSGLLHGLDRDSYKTRFSLDDDVLRAGGHEIAAARGDLGRLLHAGTSGLSGLSAILGDVQGEVDGFYRKGGSTQVMAVAKKRLKELAAEMQERRLSPQLYDDLRRAVASQEQVRDAALAALAEARRTLIHAQTAQQRRRLVVQRTDIAAALGEFPEGPDLPQGTVAEVVGLAAEAREASRRKDTAGAECGRATERLDELVPDPAGLELGPILEMIDGLTFDDRPLLHRADGADADLARRRGDRAALWQQAQALAGRLAGAASAPDQVLIAPLTLDQLDARLQDLRTAQSDLEGQQEALAEAADGHAEAVPEPPGPEALADALDRMLAEGPDLEALRDADAEAAQTARRTAEGLAEGWRDALVAVPAEDEVTKAVAAAERARAGLADMTQRLEAARAACEMAKALLAAVEDTAAAIDVAAVQRLRVAREAAWTLHRDTLDTTTADLFEAAMRTDDAGTAAHADGADARALLQTRRDDHARAVAAEALAAVDAETAEAAAATARDGLRALATRLLLAPEASPATLAPQRRALIAALEAAQAREQTRARVERAQRRHAELDAALCDALAASGGAVEDAPVLPAARRHLAALRTAASARAAWQEREKQVGQMSRRVALAQTKLARCREDLDAATAGTWAAAQEPVALRDALPDARLLIALMTELRELDHRIARMEQALETFERATERPRDILGPHPTSMQLIHAARGRLGEAEGAAREIAGQTQRYSAAEREALQARADQTAATDRILQLLAGQTPRGPEEPQVFAQRLEQRDRLRAEAARLDAAIRAAESEVDPVLLDAQDALDDPARLPGLRDAVDTAEQASQEAGRQFGAVEQELRAALAAEGAAAADQERATLHEELRSGARDAAARLIGLAAARAALRRLGESRRGQMLRDTESAFRVLTGGAWTRLETWVDGQDERLVGVSAGGPVSVDAMSTGTRAQLYLALRIAGHAAFVAEAGPLPFVTDDILESFDDGRAAAALDLTARLGGMGQAILFTHHAHLVEMARDRIAGVRVLEMPVRQTSAANAA